MEESHPCQHSLYGLLVVFVSSFCARICRFREGKTRDRKEMRLCRSDNKRYVLEARTIQRVGLGSAGYILYVPSGDHPFYEDDMVGLLPIKNWSAATNGRLASRLVKGRACSG
jgi:hypothetical protein